jgi:hypothetical protein
MASTVEVRAAEVAAEIFGGNFKVFTRSDSPEATNPVVGFMKGAADVISAFAARAQKPDAFLKGLVDDLRAGSENLLSSFEVMSQNGTRLGGASPALR